VSDVKICSFLPTATSMLYALGLGDQVVGVTHECEFPPQARDKPVVIRPFFDTAALSSLEIDRLVSDSLHRGESIYRPDLALLERLKPDLLVTQGICEVCAISHNEVEAVRERLSSKPQILQLNPHSLAEMFDDLIRVATVTGVAERGKSMVAALSARVETVERRVEGLRRPKVAAIEWLDPFYCSGHWVPELIERAGGFDGLGVKHGDSVRLTWEQVVDYQPDVLVLMPCGFDVERTVREGAMLRELPGFADLPAVRNGRAWAVWGHKYFSGAGPDLVPGLELLGAILHPDRFSAPDPVDGVLIGNLIANLE